MGDLFSLYTYVRTCVRTGICHGLFPFGQFPFGQFPFGQFPLRQFHFVNSTLSTSHFVNSHFVNFSLRQFPLGHDDLGIDKVGIYTNTEVNMVCKPSVHNNNFWVVRLISPPVYASFLESI